MTEPAANRQNTQRGDTKRRAPRKITGAYLIRAASYYLERYSASVAQLRGVLERKCARSARHHGQELASLRPLIDQAVARMIELGLVDDRRFSEGRVASLRRKGTSARMVKARLAAKGVAADTATSALAQEHVSEAEAAMTLARRKRLGPWRTDAALREEKRERDLAAMMRAGFSYSIAKQTIDGDIAPQE